MPVSPSVGVAYGRQIARLVEDSELALLRLIADALSSGDASQEAWIQQKLAELQLLRRRMVGEATRLDVSMAREVHRLVLSAYNAGSGLAVKDLDKLGVEASTAADPIGAANRLGQRAISQLHAAIVQIPDRMTAAYRQAVDAASAQVLGGSLTRIQASQSALDDLLGDGVTGFVDKAGRSWGLDTYLEMAVRTATAQAAVAGHVATLQASGVDLVIISDSGGSCPLCEPWEGKILSSSGDVAGGIFPDVTGGDDTQVDVAGSLDDATAAGLFHPNCTHTADAYLPGATDAADDAGAAPTDTELTDAQSSDGSQEYQDLQRQRTIERTIRSWKRRQALALDDTNAARASAKVSQWQAVMRQHIDATGLRRLSSREQIGGAH